MDKRKLVEPTSPEGKYWYGRHIMLIEIFKGMYDTNDERLMAVSQQVLDTEMQLDMKLIEELSSKVITNEDNLVIVDAFKGPENER